MEKIRLYNNVEIPAIGMGTFPLRGSKMAVAVDAALGCGYRAFDTAYGYANDSSLGRALQKALPEHGLTRQDVFITTKIGDRLNHGAPTGSYFYNSPSCVNKEVKISVAEQIESALQHLHTDYLDLLLIHHPFPDFHIEIWGYLEEVYREGKVRAIGVSNYGERHLRQLADCSSIKPMVNQFEHHPLNTKKQLVDYCRNAGIQVEAYSPLLVMNPNFVNSEVFIALANKYRKSIPQIILRWDIQLGIIPIPKSGNPLRLKENISVFDFELTPPEIAMIDSLNQDFKLLPESVYCPGY